MLDVALGLEYLHNQNIIHGDLKAASCICDFGLSSIVDVTLRLAQSTTSAPQKGTPRYYAPELLRPMGEKHFASDVYAFACVCYKILTENVPFHEERNDMVVIFRVIDGAHPLRMASCMGSPQLDTLWELLQSCWEEKPERRPTVSQIVQQLQGPSAI
ncbi:kinase-like domain-containing protein [Mycena filopes]|nr:kinase-like domain-containing protein [Mycena filopes]